jgi:hypothetical protein
MGFFSKKTSSKPVVDWDNIYVEIDNDANGTVANESYTKRRGNRKTFEETDPPIHAESKDSTLETRSYDMAGIGDDKTIDTPAFTNYTNSKTIGTRGSLTEVPTMDVEMPDEVSRVEAFSITKDGKYLSNNHFANAQLMRWKNAAEEGPCLVQAIAILASIAAIYTTLYPLVVFDALWSVPSGICAFHTTILCLLIIAFEIRGLGARNPLSLRARIRNTLVRHLNILRLVWGRGFLYIFAGSMNITIFYYPYNYMTGGFLIALGLLNVFMGAHAAFNLERLRLSLTDNSYLWNQFMMADSDKDNLIGINDFSNLIWSLGLELDDSYTFRAFREIDSDRDGIINFYEFKQWWITSQDDDGTIITMEYSKTIGKSKASLAKSPGNGKIPDEISTDSRQK